MTHHHTIKPEIRMTKVDSESIQAIGYNPTSRILRVQFKTGSYDYHGVSPKVHEELMKAESKGAHIRKNVLGQYRFTKVTP